MKGWRCSCGALPASAVQGTVSADLGFAFCPTELKRTTFRLVDLEAEPELRTVPPPPPPDRFDEGIRISESVATHAWTPHEKALVDRAIELVARRQRQLTADDLWRELGPNFIVTKGLAGRLMAAKHRGLIEPTGDVTFSQRVGEHGHGQRLAVWRSLVAGGQP
jgi:hypothetical protein